jgi:D-cysteine desulfhydrase/L-cysteate sulfo-lyase
LYDTRKYGILDRKISNLPRVSLANLPTPLHEAPALTRALGGPRILFKRDDLTGLGLGGNKTRQLEFRLAKAVAEGADAVIAGYGVQSNDARQTAAACSKLGLDCYLILTGNGEETYAPKGNLLLDQMLGAEVRIINSTPAMQGQMMQDLSDELRSNGRNPYIAGVDDYYLSAIGYVKCMLEMCLQLETVGLEPDFFFVSAEGSTQAGLVVGAKYLEMDAQIVGITQTRSIGKPWRCTNVIDEIVRIAKKTIDSLGIELPMKTDEIINLDGYVGEGFGEVTEEGLEAIKLVGKEEGILLDPVFTGKAMAGLIDKIRNREITEEATVVFVHTGGFPLLFEYSSYLGEILRAHG